MSPSPPLPVTEDTPPDMLAGSMDLNIILPGGEGCKMSIQRSTPMMDLLVHVTTANRLSPSNYIIQPLSDNGILPYKPSTPIGTLDTFTIRVICKKNNKKAPPQAPHAFLQSFRLQVHLPRSQLYVTRVTPEVSLTDIYNLVCCDKNLNPDKYHLLHPVRVDEILDLNKTIGYYKIQEVYLVSKTTKKNPSLTTIDILNANNKGSKNSVCDSSLSSDSFGSRSTSPVTMAPVAPPQPPVRKKRRPAPKPPVSQTDSKPSKVESSSKSSSQLISHSRESSDSSGYHEASVLSESPTHGVPSLPRHAKLPASYSCNNLETTGRLVNSVSTTSLNSTGKKKKAAPPPPMVPRIEPVKELHVEPPTKESPPVDRETPPPPYNEIPLDLSRIQAQSSVADEPAINKPKPLPRTVVKSPPVEPAKRTILPTKQLPLHNDNIRRAQTDTLLNKKSNQYKKQESVTSLKSENEEAATITRWPEMESIVDIDGGTKLTKWQDMESIADSDSEHVTKLDWLVGDTDSIDTLDTPKEEEAPDSLNIEWQYQLPPPPTNFRDVNSPTYTEFGTVTIMPEVFQSDMEPITVETKVKENKNNMVEDKVIKRKEIIIETIEPILRTSSIKETKQIEQETVQLAAAERLRQKPQKHEIYIDPQEEIRNKHFEEDKNKMNKKMEVLNELTNVLKENKKIKEKSLSYSNLYTHGEREYSSLNYISSEPMSSLTNFKISTYESNSNLNGIMEKSNLERSSSLDNVNEEDKDIFKKPKGPVERKSKSLKRSMSSIGTEHELKKIETTDELEKQFLEFLQQKQLDSNNLNLKSLKVLKNILPQINENEKVNDEVDEASSVTEVVEEQKHEEVAKVVENKPEYKMEPAAEGKYHDVYEHFRSSVIVNSKTLKSNDDLPVQKPIIPSLSRVKQPEALVIEELSNVKEAKTLRRIQIEQPIEVIKPVHEEEPKEVIKPVYQKEPKEVIKPVHQEEPKEVIKPVHQEEPKEKQIIQEDTVDKPIILKEIKKLEIQENLVAEDKPKIETFILREKEEIQVIKKVPEGPIIINTNDFKIPKVKEEKKIVETDAQSNIKKLEKRFSYQGPPSINIATWNDRPKTQVAIKNDKDYKFGGLDMKEKAKRFEEDRPNVVVKEKPIFKKSASVDTKPLVFKKPGFVTNYEKFSALPKRKEVDLIQTNEENNSRMPVVCGVELKKDVPNDVRVPIVRSVELKKEFKEDFRSINLKPNPIVRGFKIPEKKTESVPPPPPAPVVLKPVAARQLSKPVSAADQRDQLLDQIRNFGGLNRLKKTAQ